MTTVIYVMFGVIVVALMVLVLWLVDGRNH